MGPFNGAAHCPVLRQVEEEGVVPTGKISCEVAVVRSWACRASIFLYCLDELGDQGLYGVRTYLRADSSMGLSPRHGRVFRWDIPLCGCSNRVCEELGMCAMCVRIYIWIRHLCHADRSLGISFMTAS
jgi:hypothetical protein